MDQQQIGRGWIVIDISSSDSDVGQPSDQTAKPEQPDNVPKTLTEFLSVEKVSARRFAAALTKQAQLTDEDLARSGAIVADDPSRISRVAELARALAGSGRNSTVLLRWCEELLRSQDPRLSDWARDATQSPRGALDDLLNWALPQLQDNKESPARHRLEAYVVIGLNLLRSRRSLTPLDALRSLASTILPRRKKHREDSAERAVEKLVFQAGIKQLSELARIAELSDSQIAMAEDGQRKANERAEALRSEVSKLDDDCNTLRANAEGLQQALASKNAQIADLEAELAGAKTRAIHDCTKLKAQFRRQEEQLTGLLNDAWDALDADPPHPAVALERIEVARATITRGGEWQEKFSG